jgi:hypothetical protein
MSLEEELKQAEKKVKEIRKLLSERRHEKLSLSGKYVVYGDGTVDTYSELRNADYGKVFNRWDFKPRAEQARNIMTAMFELKHLADRENADWEPEYDGDTNVGYRIYYNHRSNKFHMLSDKISDCNILFKEHCLDKILPIMTDNLKLFLKGEYL